MWTVLKFNKGELEFLKTDLSNKLKSMPKFYIPKLKYQFFKKNKLHYKESFLLGDYLLCFHNDFNNQKVIESIKTCRGLRYILTGFYNSQKEIKEFVKKCNKYEDSKGYIEQGFFNFNYTQNKKFKFLSGPFTNMIFEIIANQSTKLKIAIGTLTTTINKKSNFFYHPV